MTHGFFHLPGALAEIRRGIDAGVHLGAQLYVSLDGDVRADGAVGEDTPGTPLTPDHLMLWLSATKPVTAVAMGRLWERGEIGLDDPVASVIPEFAQGGKEGVTLRHVLTHTSGFRMIRVGWPEKSWDEILEEICARRLEPRWVPGEKAGYHMSSSWFVLGEMIQRLTGRPFSEVLRDEVFEPLGMDDCWVGMPRERYDAYVGDGRIARSWKTEDPDDPEHPEPQAWHEPGFVTGVSPGGNGRGPMRELGRFYEALLHGGSLDGRRILSTPAVEAMTSPHRVGMHDHTFNHVLDWGLGFICNSNRYGADTVPYGYGPHASRRTYGHSGFRSVVAFADPTHRLAVALAFNGTPTQEAHERRIRSVLAALYEDLDLGPTPEEATP